MNVETLQTDELWTLCHPLPIEQRPVTGLDLEPINFTVITYAAWVDMGMDHLYRQSCIYYPAVGLS